MKTPAPRQLLIFGGLAVSLGLTAWVSRDAPDDAPVTAMPRRTQPGTPAPGPSGSAASPGDWPGPAATHRAEWPTPEPEVRAAWGEPPPPPPRTEPEPPPPPPPPPQAPAFPYQLVGRMTDPTPRAVLNNAQRSAVVAAGEVVDGSWRVDAVEPAGMRVTYLPLDLSQRIPFATASRP
ncbi:MAG: secretion system X translation initiation factor [Burkholderiales bacterium]|uniref:hypothetical protein n=1 Tax=Roseateles sp. TaxID=1971397 RepID=UPI000FADA6FF|nr:MAG: secretion system X translation initiation factor [Burkholderiales bacterium]